MKKEIENELREISPFLADLKKGKEEDKEPFRVPRLYFETLADKVIEKAQPQVEAVPPQYSTQPSILERIQGWVSMLLKPRYAMGFATVLVLAVAGFWMTNRSTTEPTQAPVGLVSSDLTNQEIHDYIHDNIDDFDEQIILAHESLADNDVNETINVSDEEINEYLKENMDEKDIKSIENDL